MIKFRYYFTMIITLSILSSSLIFDVSIEGEGLIGPHSLSGIEFAGGNGTESDPYQISNVTQLQNISANLTAHYVLINDINASETRDWNEGEGFDPIEDNEDIYNWFTGSIDGFGFNISGLFIKRPSETGVGLFRMISTGGKICNLSLINSYIVGKDFVGGLAGSAQQYLFFNCSFNGTISGDNYVGGLLGQNAGGTIYSCNSRGCVSGESYIGGLVGNNYGYISNSSSTGKVIGEFSVGGLVGDCMGRIENCFSICNITGEREIGGLVGSYDPASIFNSFYCIDATWINNERHVTPFGIYEEQFNDWKGQDLTLDIDDHLTFNYSENCYEISDIDDLKKILPFATYGDHKYGQTSDIDLSSEPGFYIPFLNSGFFDGKGYTISDLNITSYRYANYYIGFFGFSGEGSNIMNISLVNIIVRANHHVGGLIGTNYYGSVTNCSVSGIVSGHRFTGGLIGVNSGTVVKCSSSINLFNSGTYGGGLIGDNSGSISGCISTGEVSGYSNIGGLIGKNSDVLSYCSSNTSVKGSYNTGGLVGGNGGSIIRCFSKGKVESFQYVGGLVGKNSGTVSECYSASNLSRIVTDGGGLVGDNLGSVSNCYSVGNVKGVDVVGGLVGRNSGTVSRCYSSGHLNSSGYDIGGLVGYNDDSVTRCFWDIQTSGLSDSDGGIGRPTIEMKKGLTYLDMNWDLFSIWGIIEGTSYPFLNFQIEGVFLSIESNQGSFDIYEDSTFSIEFEFELDPCWIHGCENSVRYSLSNNSNWYSIDNDGVLSGAPSNDDVGTYNVTIEIEDLLNNKDSVDITLNVINVNDAPVILEIDPVEIIEDLEFHLDIPVIDVDPTDDNLRWTFETNASFLNIDPDTGTLSGVPGNDDVGTWRVLVNVSDGNGGFDENNILLTVLNVNDDPEILPFDIPDIYEGSHFSIDLEASDIDPTNDIMKWKIRTDASFIKINSETGNLSVFPTSNDEGDWWVNISVSDGNGGNDWREFTINILDVNNGPVSNLINLTMTWAEDFEGTSLDLNDIFHDMDGDPLSFDHIGSKSLSISINEGVATIISDENWFGTGYIHFTASDGDLSEKIVVTVIVTSVNDVPYGAVMIAEQNYIEGEDQMVTAIAFDVDLPYGDELTFLWTSNISGMIGEGRSIDLSLPVGIHLVTLTVMDTVGSSTMTSKEIEIFAEDTVEVPDQEEEKEEKSPQYFLILLILAIIVAVILLFVLFKRKKMYDRYEE